MSELKDVERLGHEPINKLLIEFSWPAILGFVAIALYEMIDRIFVGQVVGSYGLTVMAIGMPVVITINALCIMLRAGTASIFSNALGSGNYELINKFVSNILLLAFMLGVTVAGIFGYFSEYVALICAASPDNIIDAVSYTYIISVGAIGLFVGNAANVLMRALGQPRRGMMLIIGSALLNIVLDAVFVVYLEYGVAGAALGTMLAQFASGLCGIYFLRHYIEVSVKQLDAAIMRQCVFLGVPLAAFEINYMLCALILNNLISYYGSPMDLAAVPVFTSIMSMLFMPIAGLDEGAQILIGYNYAADKLQRVRKIIFHTIGAAFVFYTCSFIIVQVAAEYIVMIFDADNPEFITHAARICRIVLIVAPIMSIMHIVPGILTALGDVRYNFTLSVVLEILAQYPPLFILPMFWGVDGVFAAFPVYDIIFALAASSLLYKSMKGKLII